MFSIEQIDQWLEQLKNGNIKPDITIDISSIEGVANKITLLEALIYSDLDKIKLLQKVTQFIDQGCNVDVGGSNFLSPIEVAISVSKTATHDYSMTIETMLEHHKTTEKRSADFNLMKSALNSLNPNKMFEIVISHKNINVNSQSITGTHILHILSGINLYTPYLSLFFSLAKQTIINPLNKKGESPFTVALNTDNHNAITELEKIHDSMIIGQVTSPKLIVDNELVDRYDGDFWKDYPDMLKYALKTNNTHLLPDKLQNLFF
jgi:hypothetical protein